MGTCELIPAIAAVKMSIFDPTTVSGLLVYLDAGDASTLFTDTGKTTLVSADAQAVACIADKSGQGNDLTQATSGNRPAYKVAIQNGLSVLRFTRATPSYIDRSTYVGGSVSQPVTWFFVCKAGTTATDETFTDGGTSRHLFRPDTTGGSYLFYAGTSATFGTGDASWHVFCVVVNGASSKFYKDGGAGTSINPNTGATNGLRMGADTSPANGFGGDGGATLMYNSALSLANINYLGSGLATRWGTTWTTAT